MNQFFSVVRQPVLGADEREFREQQGWSPLVHTRYLPETVRLARVTVLSGLYRVELPADPDILYEEDRRQYPHLRVWYVLNCADFEYLNLFYGRFVSSAGAYPFDEVDREHLHTVRRGRAVRAEPGDEEIRGPEQLTFLDVAYANRMKLARVIRPIGSAADLAEVADFLYRVGRIPLTGFNTSKTLVRREIMERPGTFIVEDSIRRIVFDDVLAIDGATQPPSEDILTHVVLYERGTGDLAHHVFKEQETERDRPYARIRTPTDRAAIAQAGGRTVAFSGSARHGREILSHDRMEWHSKRDGLLGRGIGVLLPASELAPGDHTITFRVCDSAGRCAVDSWSITVDQGRRPPTRSP